ncbi:MAG: N-acetylmuramoyl-L-alanine amidase [Candidatus Zixiibacteriota bacterium]
MAILEIPRHLRMLAVLGIVLTTSAAADNTVLLDPGHGGSAYGARGANKKLYEKSVNLTVARALRDSLTSASGGWYQMGMTRNSDITVENSDRADSANIGNGGNGYAYFISVHHNSIDTMHNSTQGTEAWHCMSDTILGGSWRDVDSLMAYKIYLRLVENWDAPNDPYVARGLGKNCGYTVLIKNRRISLISEASFLSDSLEENLFVDPSNFHAKDEAGAICRGFMSYCDNAGIAQISNRYVNGNGGTLEIDYLELSSPVDRTWAMFEQHNLYVEDYFYLGGYWYYFHHWSHLLSDGTYLGPDHFDNDWNITVPAESNFHIYRAYFSGGPYWAEIELLPAPAQYAVGDTVMFLWSGSMGVDSSTVVSLYLDRHNGSTGYPELRLSSF